MMPRLFRLLPVVLASAAFTATPAHPQDLVVAGRVLDAAGEGVAGQHVVLHRVDATGGATIAEATSAAGGSFEMTAPAATDTAAVYFVAARFEGELYIGAPFRPGQGEQTDLVVYVGRAEMSATALMAEAQPQGAAGTGRPATSRNWMLLIIPLLGVAGVAVFALVPRGRIPRVRSLLIRVAQLDERLDSAPQAQRETLLAERQRLITQLRES